MTKRRKLMKKIVSILIIVCIMTATLAFSVSASPDLSQKDAEKLLIDGYQRMQIIYCSNEGGPYAPDDPIRFEYGSEGAHIYFEYNTKGEKVYEGTPYKYIDDERFKTLDDCYAYLEATFTDEIAKDMVERNPYTEYGDSAACDSIRLSDGGIEKNDGINVNGIPPISAESGKLVCLYAPNGRQNSAYLNEIYGLTVSGNKATMKVLHYRGTGTIGYKEEIKTVTFVNTEKGWRISGGSLFDYYMIVGDYLSPDTGDGTTVYVLGAVIALLMTAVPLSVGKRKTV